MILTTDEPTNTKAIAWVHTYRKSPVCYLQPGHGPSIYGQKEFRRRARQRDPLVRRATWAVGEIGEDYAGGDSCADACARRRAIGDRSRPPTVRLRPLKQMRQRAGSFSSGVNQRELIGASGFTVWLDGSITCGRPATSRTGLPAASSFTAQGKSSVGRAAGKAHAERAVKNRRRPWALQRARGTMRHFGQEIQFDVRYTFPCPLPSTREQLRPSFIDTVTCPQSHLITDDLAQAGVRSDNRKSWGFWHSIRIRTFVIRGKSLLICSRTPRSGSVISAEG